jgi:hypothetical protein
MKDDTTINEIHAHIAANPLPTSHEKELKEYFGVLSTFWETGFENFTGLIVEDDRGWYGPNKEFMSMEWTGWIGKDVEIEVYAADGVTVEFPRTRLTKDHEGGWALRAFKPLEVDRRTWVGWFNEKRRARLWAMVDKSK